MKDNSRTNISDEDLFVEFPFIGRHVKLHAYLEMLDELQRALCAHPGFVMSGFVRDPIAACEIVK